MNTESEALILDLAEWVAARPRPHAEVMAAWRTSCPRLTTVWQDALDRGLVRRERQVGAEIVSATPAGREALAEAGRNSPSSDRRPSL